MWEYKTEIFKIMRSDKISVDDKLNEFGKEGWEVFQFLKQEYIHYQHDWLKSELNLGQNTK